MPGRSVTSWVCIAAMLIGGVLPVLGVKASGRALPAGRSGATSSADTMSRSWVFVLELDSDAEPITNPFMHGPVPGLLVFISPVYDRPTGSCDACFGQSVPQPYSQATLLYGLCRLTV